MSVSGSGNFNCTNVYSVLCVFTLLFNFIFLLILFESSIILFYWSANDGISINDLVFVFVFSGLITGVQRVYLLGENDCIVFILRDDVLYILYSHFSDNIFEFVIGVLEKW
jgi:uncharacterized membrane protein YhfC